MQKNAIFVKGSLKITMQNTKNTIKLEITVIIKVLHIK